MKIQINEGPMDRVVRLIAGIALIALAITGVLSGALAIAGGVIGAILAVTGATGFCPLYSLLGLNTCPVRRPR